MRRAALPIAALVIAAAAVVAGVLIWDAIAGDPGGPTWSAEFTNARGLLAGNDVRVDGAVVGRVTSISLASDGDALVHFRLFSQAAAPRSDAAASIEAADLLGDNYMSLSPGVASSRLHGPIRASRTVDAPRLDEVLDAFSPDVRDGLQTLLVEGGLALEDRAGSLTQATVALRPALSAAHNVLTELSSQNGSLAGLVPVAARAASEIDSRRGDIGPLLDELARTLNGTAGASAALDRGLAGLPSTLTQLRTAAERISGLTGSATPLVGELRPAASTLGHVVQDLPSLLDRVRGAAPAFDAALNSARSALSIGSPALAQSASAFGVLRAQAPDLSSLMSEFDAAAPGISQGFFVDFPDQADESGKQPFDPFAEPTRNYWRGAAVLSCEAFGVPVAPGCLTKAIANLDKVPAVKFKSTSSLLQFLLGK
jgi:phospholipid/cholesterol/gamma-HCH transport system substrate-binding protein